jgi:hypothetical protein
VALNTNGGPSDDGRFNGYFSRNLFNTVTIANGGITQTGELDINGDTFNRAANVPIGVASYNFFEGTDLDMADTLPRVKGPGAYIEMPLIGTPEAAAAFHFGSAIGTLRGGDFVCSDANGRFVKFNEYPLLAQSFLGVIPSEGDTATVTVDQPIKNMGGAVDSGSVAITVYPAGTKANALTTATVPDVKFAAGQIDCAGLVTTGNVDIYVSYTSAIPQGHEQIIGQVYAVDSNLPPEGWLKWVEWTMEQKLQDADYTRLGFSHKDIEDGYPYSYYYRQRVFGDQLGTMGIPGLTNGSNIETEFTKEVIGTVHKDVPVGTVYTLYLKHKRAIGGSLKIYINDADVTGDALVEFDALSGLVILKTVGVVDTVAAADYSITASYKATGQIPGVPTNWDFKGSVGAARILLMKL